MVQTPGAMATANIPGRLRGLTKARIFPNFMINRKAISGRRLEWLLPVHLTIAGRGAYDAAVAVNAYAGMKGPAQSLTASVWAALGIPFAMPIQLA
jgi:hypothetical protein